MLFPSKHPQNFAKSFTNRSIREAFCEVLRVLAREEHLGIIAELVTLCGAIAFVAMRAAVALFARSFRRPKLKAEDSCENSSPDPKCSPTNDDSQIGGLMSFQPVT